MESERRSEESRSEAGERPLARLARRLLAEPRAVPHMRGRYRYYSLLHHREVGDGGKG